MAQAPLILALDVSSPTEARQWVRRLYPQVSVYKIGMQLFYQSGAEVVKQVQEEGGRIFLDLKLHDIPHTVARGVESLLNLQVDFLTIHTSGGPEMMAAAQAVAQSSPLKLLGVTALTSLNDAHLQAMIPHCPLTVSEWALNLAQLAKAAGLYGLVCSAHENRLFREQLGTDIALVNPGIRPRGSAANDQQRVMTPAEAVAAGADYLVIGRPILQAADPEGLVASIIEEIGKREARLSP